MTFSPQCMVASLVWVMEPFFKNKLLCWVTFSLCLCETTIWALVPDFKFIWKNVWLNLLPWRRHGPWSHGSDPQGLRQMTVFQIGNVSRTESFSMMWESPRKSPRATRHSCTQTKLRNIMENSKLLLNIGTFQRSRATRNARNFLFRDKWVELQGSFNLNAKILLRDGGLHSKAFDWSGK